MEKAQVTIPACFKAYDIRGRVPDQLNPRLAYEIGLAFGSLLDVSKVVVGHDIRLSSIELMQALSKGLMAAGVDVLDCGLCGTEEIYHATFSLEPEGVDGGIVITASHNPADYNGMKFVVRGARAVTGSSGLSQMAQAIGSGNLPLPQEAPGRAYNRPGKDSYIQHLLSYVSRETLRPLKLVVNSGNGCAGPILDLLQPHLPFTFIPINHHPDGDFPKGVPNPLLPENRQETAELVKSSGADMGIAWDGDFDRCFFWDERGTFIESYYIVGLLARELLKNAPGSTILHDPRLTWNTIEQVRQAGGDPLETCSGHAEIKDRMRQENALYGGEMSAHHYFRDFGFCDSGMIPWLLVCSLVSESRIPLSQHVAACVAAYPVSGEINSSVGDPDAVIERIENRYGHGEISRIDGLSIAFPAYRFNIRKSNTEPLLRLNVESRGDKQLLERVTRELLALINS